METPELRLGFLGFGEAGYHLAKGLAGEGLTGIVAYDKYADDPKAGNLIRHRATEAGIPLIPSVRRLCREANWIIALVPGRVALRAVRAAAPHLTADHVYVDAGTASVNAMKAAGRILEGKAGFVDVAMMGAVPLSGHKVAILASGPHAEAFRAAMQPYGMNIRVVGEHPGAATAMKLIRSVFMKGLATVILEALEAAHRHGVLHETAQGMAEYMDQHPFRDHIRRFVCGTAVHAERRVFEMGEVLAFLKELGSSDTMTKGTRKGLQRIAALGLRERFGGAEPADIAVVLEALTAKPLALGHQPSGSAAPEPPASTLRAGG